MEEKGTQHEDDCKCGNHNCSQWRCVQEAMAHEFVEERRIFTPLRSALDNESQQRLITFIKTQLLHTEATPTVAGAGAVDGGAVCYGGSKTSTDTSPGLGAQSMLPRLLTYDDSKHKQLQQQHDDLDHESLTRYQLQQTQKEVAALDMEVEKETKADTMVTPTNQVTIDHNDTKLTLEYWASKGLSTEGIDMRKKKLLCRITPDDVLCKYFSKKASYIVADKPMDNGMKLRMQKLYEKVYERPFVPIHGKYSVIFGRAFTAQELWGKKVNWAEFAWSEYWKVAERNAKDARSLLLKQSPNWMMARIQGSNDNEHSTNKKDENHVVNQQYPDSMQVEGSAIQHTTPSAININYNNYVDLLSTSTMGEAPLIASPPIRVNVTPTSAVGMHVRVARGTMAATSTTPSRAISEAPIELAAKVHKSTMNMDQDLQSLRTDLMKRLAHTSVMENTLQAFDDYILRYISCENRKDEKRKDLQVNISILDDKCMDMQANIYYIMSRIEVEVSSMEQGKNKLEDLLSNQPGKPERDREYSTWIKWCTDLQEELVYIGCSENNVQEHCKVLTKLNGELEDFIAKKKALMQLLVEDYGGSSLELDNSLSRDLKRARLA